MKLFVCTWAFALDIVTIVLASSDFFHEDVCEVREDSQFYSSIGCSALEQSIGVSLLATAARREERYGLPLVDTSIGDKLPFKPAIQRNSLILRNSEASARQSANLARKSPIDCGSALASECLGRCNVCIMCSGVQSEECAGCAQCDTCIPYYACPRNFAMLAPDYVRLKHVSPTVVPPSAMTAEEAGHMAVQRASALSDCLVSDWSEWSACEDQSHDGLVSHRRARTRDIVNPQINEGKPCPALDMRELCLHVWSPPSGPGTGDEYATVWAIVAANQSYTAAVNANLTLNTAEDAAALTKLNVTSAVNATAKNATKSKLTNSTSLNSAPHSTA